VLSWGVGRSPPRPTVSVLVLDRDDVRAGRQPPTAHQTMTGLQRLPDTVTRTHRSHLNSGRSDVRDSGKTWSIRPGAVDADRVTHTMRFGYDGDGGPGDRLLGLWHRSTSCHTTRLHLSAESRMSRSSLIFGGGHDR